MEPVPLQVQSGHSNIILTRNSLGFTLIELLMVLTLMAILATIGITQYVNFSQDAQIAVTKEKLNVIKTAINGDARFVAAGTSTKQGYEAHCLAPPSVITDLVTMPGSGTCSAVYDPFTKQGWRGPYVSTTDPKWNFDAWGTAIQYFNAGPPARTIRSCGPDKTCGNADDISITF